MTVYTGIREPMILLVVPVLVNLSPGSAVRVFHNNRNKQPQQTAAANNRNKQQQQKTIKS